MNDSTVVSGRRSVEADIPAMLPSVEQNVDDAIQSTAGYRLDTAGSEEQLLVALARIGRGEHQGPLIWDLHSGLLEF